MKVSLTTQHSNNIIFIRQVGLEGACYARVSLGAKVVVGRGVFLTLFIPGNLTVLIPGTWATSQYLGQLSKVLILSLVLCCNFQPCPGSASGRHYCFPSFCAQESNILQDTIYTGQAIPGQVMNEKKVPRSIHVHPLPKPVLNQFEINACETKS